MRFSQREGTFFNHLQPCQPHLPMTSSGFSISAFTHIALTFRNSTTRFQATISSFDVFNFKKHSPSALLLSPTNSPFTSPATSIRIAFAFPFVAPVYNFTSSNFPSLVLPTNNHLNQFTLSPSPHRALRHSWRPTHAEYHSDVGTVPTENASAPRYGRVLRSRKCSTRTRVSPRSQSPAGIATH